MNLIDTHCHLTFDDYEDNLFDVLERSRAAGVTKFITVGTDIEHCRKVVQLCDEYEDIYGTVGIHPHYADDAGDEYLETIQKLAEHEKVTAIGEIGLDFHYDFSDKDKQKSLLAKQLEIASRMSLPVVIHSREAVKETLEIVEDFEDDIPKIVFHCFTDTKESAEKIIEKGFYISFTGVITFKNADSAREVVKVVPLDRMMLETDCPFMSPAPKRNQRPNEPGLMVHTLQKIAELKGVSARQAAEKLTETSRKFFKI
jgi:TatD DNase family protein